LRRSAIAGIVVSVSELFYSDYVDACAELAIEPLRPLELLVLIHVLLEAAPRATCAALSASGSSRTVRRSGGPTSS